MIKMRIWLITSVLLLLSACSAIEKEQPVNYYVLDAKPSALTTKAITQNIAIDRVELPDYLNQPNIVLRDDSQKLHVAYYHSWADDLGSSIRRVIISELNVLSNDSRFSARCTDCESIKLSLNHFYPTTEGEVVLAGDYQIKPLNKPMTTQSFLITLDLENDGYEHAVDKMRLALFQLAAKINNTLIALTNN
jgi:uncharacterized lipoprotein YmbA